MQVHALLAMAHVSGGYSAEPLDLMDIRVGLLAQIVGTKFTGFTSTKVQILTQQAVQRPRICGPCRQHTSLDADVC